MNIKGEGAKAQSPWKYVAFFAVGFTLLLLMGWQFVVSIRNRPGEVQPVAAIGADGTAHDGLPRDPRLVGRWENGPVILDLYADGTGRENYTAGTFTWFCTENLFYRRFQGDDRQPVTPPGIPYRLGFDELRIGYNVYRKRPVLVR